MGNNNNILVITLVVIFFCLCGAFGFPQYRVWQQAKEGEAQLAKAEQNRQIAILEAKAQKEAAEQLAEAEKVRAKGIAAANEIIGQSLNDNKAYLQWRFIEAIKTTQNQVIYVPVENMLPVTEATRLNPAQ